MTFRKTLVSIIIFTSGILLSHAQPATVQQLENTRLMQELETPLPGLHAGTNAPELYPGENEDVGPQRILRLNPRPNYFSGLLDSQFLYTDNANFAQNPFAIPSAVFVNTVQAALTPPAWKIGDGKVVATAGFASQWYNYWNERMAPFDFDAQTFFAGVKYNIGDWQFGISGNYTRLLSQANYNQTYTEWLPVLAVQRIFPINDKMLLAIGNQIDYHFTDVPAPPGGRTDVNDRFDDSISVTLSWQLMRHLVLQPYYRFQYSSYYYNTALTSSRNDYLHSFGVTLFYYFTENISARVYFNYNRKLSDDNLTPEYHEYNGGVGGAVSIKF